MINTVNAKSFGATLAAISMPLAAAPAWAQDNTSIGYGLEVTFDGSLLFLNGNDKLGTGGDKLGDNRTYFDGGFSVGGIIQDDIDWKASAAFSFGPKNSVNFIETDGVDTVTLDAEQYRSSQILDLDIGKRFNFANSSVRVFGGVRAMRGVDSFDYSVAVDKLGPPAETESADKLGKSEYYGAGPRLGIEGYYSLRPSWGLVGSLIGTATFGQQKFSIDANSSEGGSLSDSITFDARRLSVEAEAGVQFELKPGASITGGYRVEAWDNRISAGGDSETSNPMSHGPFLRLSVKM